ncbi:MAG: hypothetical protein ONB46_09490 [candidate division KSB1 bacterium]|nr:hypothetical protein [candidate division KSB1 bacterium]MDZ7366035.1 hypothetical protein [candidate division KSB1 bacterium]MDZ7404152.1 hypothetical protein [candidate division KSB1 bacterium]
MKNYLLMLAVCSLLFFYYPAFKQPPTLSNELVKINLYSDKTVLQEGDSLFVLVEIVNLSQDTLQILDLKFVSLEFAVIKNSNCSLLIAPASSELCDFYLQAKNSSISNLIAKANVRKFNSAVSSKSVTVIKQLEQIQIISLSRASKEPKGSFDWISLLLGAVFGYLGNLVANTQTGKMEIKKNKAKLLHNLRPQLQVILQSIKDKKIVKTQWLDENLIALVTMAQEITPERDLGVELISLRDSLREYNEKLQRKQSDAKLISKLKTELSDIIDILPLERTSK